MELFSLFANRKSALCAALIALLAMPVFAVAPVKFSQSLTQDYTFTTCSYGDLNAESTLNIQGIAFRDTSLNTTRVQLHFAVNTIITNPLNNKTASGFQASNETFNVDDGSFVIRGLFTNITVAGGGVVMQIAGQLAVDGNGNVVSFTPLFQKANTDGLCAALQ